MTKAELMIKAKSLGLKGYSRKNKAGLLAMVERARLAAKSSTSTKSPTVAMMRAEAKARGLKGYSKLRKADMAALLANTARLATVEPTDEEQIVATIAALPVDNRTPIAIARVHAGRATPADERHLKVRELTAVKILRDTATCERKRIKWTDRYIGLASGVYAC